MARNGSGTYSLPSGNPVVTGTTISSTTHNATMSDIATALTQSLAKDGQTTPSADLPMGGYKHTNVGSATARTQYPTAAQVQDGTFTLLSTISGTDTITAAAPLTLAAYAEGQCFQFTSAGANTGAATLNINSLGAKSITKNGTTALAAGNIPSGAVVVVRYDGTQFQLINVKNPEASQAEMEAGTEAGIRDMSPLRVSQAIVAQRGETQLFSISASVGSNALTISAGTLVVDFRSSTLTSGTITRVIGDPADLVISSGSTLGTVSTITSRLAVLALNNSGTIELAVINMAGGVNLAEDGVISTTAEGGLGAADSATVAYSTTARTNVSYRVIGYIESTQATAGAWASAPSLIMGSGGQLTTQSSIGYGQTWQAVTRTTSLTYYNTTSKPILLHTYAVANTGNSTLTCTINLNTTITYVAAANSGDLSVGCLIIPPFASYAVNATGGWSSITHYELR